MNFLNAVNQGRQSEPLI